MIAYWIGFGIGTAAGVTGVFWVRAFRAWLAAGRKLDEALAALRGKS